MCRTFIYFVKLRSSLWLSEVCACRISVVESIPENLTYSVGSPLHPSIYDAWMRLIASATKSIDVAAFYWTLRSSDLKFQDPSDWQVLAWLHMCKGGGVISSK